MTPKLTILACVTAALAFGLSAIPARAQTASMVGDCSTDAIQAMAPANTIVFSADRVATPVPHCKIEGFITATDPGPNRSYFRLQLPDKAHWKGRFYFVGLGGSAGYVPTNSQFPAGNPMVKGFAVAGTDTGHRGAVLDWSFLDDPPKMVDHRDRAGHLTTVAAQQITKAYYGVTKIWRYHTGCSGGGRMGSEAITRHPEDYDGVLMGERSGISDNRTLEFSNYRFIYNAQAMHREPGAWLSPAKLKMVEAQVTAACDMTDGAKDGIVWDAQACRYDVAKLRCKAGDGPDCLTQPEITSIKLILAGPIGPGGEKLAAGWPITNMSNWSSFLGSRPPPWSRSPAPEDMQKTASGYIIALTRGAGVFGDDFEPLNFNLKDPASIETWESKSRALGFTLVPDPTGFEKAGGKLMLFVGASSQCCTAVEMADWYNKWAKSFGPERTANFMAMYRAPGIGHCSGGPGPQDGPDVVLQALVDWVEAGKRPGALVAHRGEGRTKLMFAANVDVPALPIELTGGKPLPQPLSDGVSREFLLCPYPQKSEFDRSKAKTPGAVYEAANWRCRPRP